MEINNDEYPKEIVTFEKITEDSDDFEKVITIVSNKQEENAVSIAIAYLDAFNERKASKCDELLNFPHVRLGMRTKDININEKPPQIPPGFFDWFIKEYKWNHTCWDYRKIIQSHPEKVHLAIQFSRYGADGTKIGSFPSLWIITKQKGHWGIKMRSSFAP